MKVLIDCNNVAHIVNHAMGHLSTDEQATGVIFGFMKQMLSLSNKMKSNEFVFAWDSRKSWRKNIYPEYKANRSKPINPEEENPKQDLFNQISELRKTILPGLGFKNNFIKTGYEADDLIAYIALMNPKEEFTIVSTDQDLYQLLSDKVRIYNIITKQFFTRADFEAKFSLHPCMYREIKAISGCFDKETEILTNEGWKYFYNLQKDDLVYSLNTQTDITSYEKIKNIISYKYKGEMYQIKGRHCDLLVTPNHKFFGCHTTMGYKKIKDPLCFKKFSI
jgi:5''-3'' exonuclease (including N-terminal domain of PolI)